MLGSTRACKSLGEIMQPLWDSMEKDVLKAYEKWSETYEEDIIIMGYQGPNMAVDLISSNFSMTREEAQVLDVACGPGNIAKMMSKLGFRHFVGIDMSRAMLDKAAETGLYAELKQAKLGTEALPAEAAKFDVVLLIGALQPKYMPLTVLRELCAATKPGGLICFTQTHYKYITEDYIMSVEKEMQLLQDEGLWTIIEIRKCDRFLKDECVADTATQDEKFISATAYLVKKCIKNPPDSI